MRTFLQKKGIFLQRHCNAYGKCIVMLSKSFLVGGRYESPDFLPSSELAGVTSADQALRIDQLVLMALNLRQADKQASRQASDKPPGTAVHRLLAGACLAILICCFACCFAYTGDHFRRVQTCGCAGEVVFRRSRCPNTGQWIAPSLGGTPSTVKYFRSEIRNKSGNTPEMLSEQILNFQVPYGWRSQNPGKYRRFPPQTNFRIVLPPVRLVPFPFLEGPPSWNSQSWS